MQVSAFEGQQLADAEEDGAAGDFYECLVSPEKLDHETFRIETENITPRLARDVLVVPRVLPHLRSFLNDLHTAPFDVPKRRFAFVARLLKQLIYWLNERAADDPQAEPLALVFWLELHGIALHGSAGFDLQLHGGRVVRLRAEGAEVRLPAPSPMIALSHVIALSLPS